MLRAEEPKLGLLAVAGVVFAVVGVTPMEGGR